MLLDEAMNLNPLPLPLPLPPVEGFWKVFYKYPKEAMPSPLHTRARFHTHLQMACSCLVHWPQQLSPAKKSKLVARWKRLTLRSTTAKNRGKKTITCLLFPTIHVDQTWIKEKGRAFETTLLNEVPSECTFQGQSSFGRAVFKSMERQSWSTQHSWEYERKSRHS